tara:strand:- start:47 stop:460 length:414 start_codon:yes stop_codon:yes gene_type:complete
MKKYIIHRTNNVLPSNKGFGLTFCVIFLIFFSIKYYFSNSLNSSYPFLIISGFFLLGSLTKPNIFYLLNKLWSKFGYFLSRIFNPIFLFLCYLFVIIPTGFFMKIFFKYDPMKLKNKDNTLWNKRDIEPNPDLKDQF